MGIRAFLGPIPEALGQSKKFVSLFLQVLHQNEATTGPHASKIKFSLKINSP
jgi:hypothetical protein